MKTCTACKEAKPLTEFGKRKASKDGLTIYCKSCLRNYYKKYYSQEEQKKKKAEYFKQYYPKNKETILARGKEWRETNREKYLEGMRDWYRRNKQKKLELSKQYYSENEHNRSYRRIVYQRRRARLKHLPHTLTQQEWEDCLQYFNYQCAYCGATGAMTHEHVTPVTLGGGYTKDNIIPACHSCNSSKCDTVLEVWYPKQEFFTEERLNKILKYLEA